MASEADELGEIAGGRGGEGASLTREGPSHGRFRRPRCRRLPACWTHVKRDPSSCPRNSSGGALIRLTHGRGPGPALTKQGGLSLNPCHMLSLPGQGEERMGEPHPRERKLGEQKLRGGRGGRKGGEEAGVCGILSPCPPQPSIPHPSGPLTPHPTLIWPPCAWPAPEYTLPNNLSWAVRGSMRLPRPDPAGSCREVPNKSWRATKRTWRGGEVGGEREGAREARLGQSYEPGSGILRGRP